MLSNTENLKFILGSSSPRRLELLKQINFYPNEIFKPEINEDPQKKELPISYVKRMAREKMDVVKKKFPNDLILTADTIVYVGRRIIDKTNEQSKAIKFLELLSGRRHRVSTAFNLFCKDKIDSLRVVTSVVKMKRLTDNEIKSYIETNEWKGKAGVYKIQGSAEKFIQFISGSYTNIVGLPLNQVYGSLNSIGYYNEK
ncbi:MAG: septum formation protein Maf [Alphaproteobacteria bacterium]|nr:MAG: septum formation protein Maf [Alphaproteobacteria bacterium]